MVKLVNFIMGIFYHNIKPWDVAKAVLRGKFIALNAHIRQEVSQINNVRPPLQKSRKRRAKQAQNKQKEVIKIRVEINEVEKEIK